MNANAAAVEFRAVDIVFAGGRRRRLDAALALLDGGAGRAEILAETGCVLGVAGADLAVRPGEICVLMGLSGSGKSTLLRSVNGLNPVTRGAVLIDDDGRALDPNRCGARALRALRRHRVSMVFQQFALLPWRSVAENVGFGLELRGGARATRAALVRDKLALVGLSEWADKPVGELSGGMQQRVGLARAFATDADILLMDEPFSALDPLIRGRLQDELLALQQAMKKTIIFVSHDLDEALKIGNRIVIMEGGRIVQLGEPEQIVLNPASDYVADFVAHMNPLNVLRGASLMTPLAEIERDGRRLRLSGTLSVDVDASQRPVTADDAGRPLQLWRPPDGGAEPAPRSLVAVDAEVKFYDALKLRQQSGRPLLLLTADGAVAGVVGDREIYRGLLRQSQSAASSEVV